MYKKYLINQKGITLLETVLVLAIFSFVIIISFPMIKITSQSLNIEQKELVQRSDIRNASTYLTNDIRYSKDVSINGLDNKAIEIIDKNNNTVNYYLNTKGNLARKVNSGEEIEFNEIKDVSFEILNNNLVQATLNNGDYKVQLKELKIARWNSEAPENNIITTIRRLDGHLVTDGLSLDNAANILGEDTVAIIKNDLTIGNNPSFDSRTIYIDGDYIGDNSSTLGPLDGTGKIYINGDCTLHNNASVQGEITINGSLYDKSHNIPGVAYVNDNIEFTGNNYDSGHIYYNGQLKYSKSPNMKKLHKNNPVEDYSFAVPETEVPPEVNIRDTDWFEDNGYQDGMPFNDGEKVYRNGDVSVGFNGSTKNDPLKDIIIVSETGNIELSNNTHATGIIIAPEGTVTFAGCTFTGVIIAKNVVILNNSKVTSVGAVYSPEGTFEVNNGADFFGAVYAKDINIHNNCDLNLQKTSLKYLDNFSEDELPFE
ncbi:MAG: hypothetical protein ACOCRO_02955 [Halanaerobiales bacterium]